MPILLRRIQEARKKLDILKNLLCILSNITQNDGTALFFDTFGERNPMKIGMLSL